MEYRRKTRRPGRVSHGGGFANKYCLEFNNGVTDERVNFGNILTFTSTDNFSISAWVKPTSTGNRCFCGKRASSGNLNGYSYQINSGGDMRVDIDGGATGYALIAGQPTGDAWNHVVFAWDGTNDDVTSWINGVLQGGPDVFDASAYTLSSPGTFGIGSQQGGEEFQPFKGRIKDVSVFNTALTTANVQTIYNNGKPSNLTGMSGLIRWYRLGDGGDLGAVAIIDQVNQVTEGTLVNMTVANFVEDSP